MHDLQVPCVRVWPLHGGCAIRARGMPRGMQTAGRACRERGVGHGPATQPQFFCALTTTRLSLSPHFLIEGNHLYPPPRTPPFVGTLCPAAGSPFDGDGTNMGQEKTSGRGEHPNRLVAAPPRTIARRTADAAVKVRLFALPPSIIPVFGTVCPAARVGETRKANRENKKPRETAGRDHGTYSQKESL